MKDYYKILELEVSATKQDIKKAYRRLAQLSHPDKNPGDPYAAARFTEIKEAYEVLTDPRKKEFYLEQRWFQQSMGRKRSDPIITPVNVLKAALEFDRHVSKLDIHRVNKEGFYKFILDELLPEETVQKLNEFDERSVNDQIINLVLKNLFVVPAARMEEIRTRLQKLTSQDPGHNIIQTTITKYQREDGWERYRAVFILLLVVVICLLIYLVSRN